MRSVGGPTWSRGSADLWLGDAAELVRGVGPCDAILMDPPYCSGARRDADRQVRGSMLYGDKADEDWFSHDNMTTWGFQWFMRQVLLRALDVLSKGAHVYCFTDWRQAPTVFAVMESVGLRVNHCLVWKKPYYGLGSTWRNQYENIVFGSVGPPAAMLTRKVGSVLECAAVSGARKVHPTEKPVELLRQIVAAIPAERVLDPFCGSAAVGEAALLEGRAFAGVEIDRSHFETACRRLSGLLFT